ncbi:hypothetical protein [Thalassomonas haliotis]|uniref:LysM domain-containing protein n=1 Tax=Thalassomonas haliotis TaxID=485448 RepID=A0ABY7V774_9GAMM|nr:hypothetical protein [Thalassomonas haliotis]WDE09529.1 hypothetical protein H3N35_14400 [Thalassomonas haliotis]
MINKRIYGGCKYCLAVAKANNISNFRELEVGQCTIYFPPLNQQVGK